MTIKSLPELPAFFRPQSCPVHGAGFGALSEDRLFVLFLSLERIQGFILRNHARLPCRQLFRMITEGMLRVIAVIGFLLCLMPFRAVAVEQFKSELSAQQHCPGDTVVWLNLRSGSIHLKGQSWYGRTHTGAYICRTETTKYSVKEIKNDRNEMAGWTRVVEDKNRSVYASSAPVEKNGARVTILSMVDLKQAATLTDGKPFLSWETQYEFDCQKRLSRMVAASMYSGNMGEGEVTNSIEYEVSEGKAIPAGSNGEILWKFACGKK